MADDPRTDPNNPKPTDPIETDPAPGPESREPEETEDAESLSREWLYGELNPWALESAAPTLDPGGSKFMQILNNTVVDSYNTDCLSGQVVFKAEVLYAWQEPGPSKVGYLAMFPELINMVHIKARIPELDSFPIPKALPLANDPADQNADWAAINRYRTYPASDTLVSAYGLPQPGQIIHVGFETINPYHGPLYLGPIDKDYIYVGVPVDATSPFGSSLYTLGRLPPPNPKPVKPGEFPESLQQGTYMIFGDSQARGSLGKTVELRLREYGLTPAQGFDRGLTTRVGAQIREFVPMGSDQLRNLTNLTTTGIHEGGPTNGRSGPKTIEPFLLQSPKNVIWVGGGNSAPRKKDLYKKAMKEIIDNITKIAGTGTKISLIGPPTHFTKYEDLAKNQEYNNKRLQVNVAFEELAAEYDNVYAFNGYKYFSDQKQSDTGDGVHLNISGAKKMVNRIFPPRSEEEQRSQEEVFEPEKPPTTESTR